MNLGKTVARCGVERVFLCESIPVQTHVLNAFGGRAACDLDKNHIFPWGVLATITMVGDGARDAWTRAGAGCEVGHTLFSVAIIAPLWV